MGVGGGQVPPTAKSVPITLNDPCIGKSDNIHDKESLTVSIKLICKKVVKIQRPFKTQSVQQDVGDCIHQSSRTVDYFHFQDYAELMLNIVGIHQKARADIYF